MLAAMTSTAELRLDKQEAKMLAEASGKVMAHYPAAQLSEHALDIVGLVSCVGMIYGPRVMAIRNNRRKARGGNVENIASLDEMRARRDKVNAAPAPIIETTGPAAPVPTAQAKPGQRNMVDIPGVGMVNIGPRG